MSSSSSQSNGVHFFRFIQEGNLRDGKLKVPTSFVKNYWEGVSNPVTLSLPNKTEWKVNWKKDDGDIWFCNNGWKEFANYVSLSELQFVVFHYEGNSCFNVIVLARNGLEIKYPSTIIDTTAITAVAEVKQEEVDDESDCSLKILDHPPSLPKYPPESSKPHKKRKTNSRDQKECHLSKLQSSQPYKNKKKKTRNGKKKVEAHSGFHNAAKHLNSGSSSSNDLKQRMKAFHESVKKDFQSEKDFFTCAIKKTYFERDILNIPNEFSRLHLGKMVGRSVTLFDVSKNKTWDVQLRKRCNGQFAFTSGWSKFSRDNSLKIGDLCAFLFTKTKGLTFQVVYNRFEKDISTTPHFEENSSDQELLNRPSSSSLSPHRTPNSPKVGCKWLSEKEFICYINKNSSQMNLSVKIVKNFISENAKIVILGVGENWWPVKVLLYEHRFLAKLSQGWSKFFQDCELKEGDSCYFKLVDEDKLVFEVTINSKMQLLN